MSQWDLERKLRTAQKITVCNEVLDLDKDRSTILPEVLLNRISKPCSALILWQPPPTLDKLLNVHETKNTPNETKTRTRAGDNAPIDADEDEEEKSQEMMET